MQPANDNTPRPAWFDAKLSEYSPMINKLANNARRRGGADDLAQDIRLAAMERWESYRPDDFKFGTWIAWVARSVISTAKIKAETKKRTVVMADRQVSAPATQQVHAELAEVLSRLSGTRDSEVLLRFAMGEDLAAIGAEMGISRERARQLCERERKRLIRMAA